MSKLMLPPHVAAEHKRRKEAAVVQSITKSATNSLTSDDFVTPEEVVSQIKQLEDFIRERQETDPRYDIPRALGWRLTVLMLTIPETTAGGVHVVDDMRESRAMSSPQGVVLQVGPMAYQDRARFELDGGLAPWVSVGDRVIWKKYDVSTFMLANGQRLGFMNDTQPIGLVDSGWIQKEETNAG